jgi:hypothetical protein
MKKPLTQIGQEVREMTDDEFAQYKLDQETEIKRQAKTEVMAQAKLVAQAKLAALGLTVEDLQALGL